MSIIEQGFVCNEPQYYLFGFKKRNSKELVPALFSDNKNRHRFCALVSNVCPGTKSYKYLDKENLTEELLSYAREHNYKLL